MRDGKNGREVYHFSRCVLLDVVLVVGKLCTLAKTDITLWRTVAGDVLERASAVGIDGCNGGLTTDLRHSRTGEARRRACDVAVSKDCGDEEAKTESCRRVHCVEIMIRLSECLFCRKEKKTQLTSDQHKVGIRLVWWPATLEASSIVIVFSWRCQAGGMSWIAVVPGPGRIRCNPRL